MNRLPGNPVKFRFRLFVAGEAPNSLLAIANLNAFCREHLPQQHTIEVIDVFTSPDVALSNRVLMTPTLVRLSPAPTMRVVGSLSRVDALWQIVRLGHAA